MATRPDADSEARRPPWSRGRRLLFLISGAALLRMSDAELAASIRDALAEDDDARRDGWTDHEGGDPKW